MLPPLAPIPCQSQTLPGGFTGDVSMVPLLAPMPSRPATSGYRPCEASRLTRGLLLRSRVTVNNFKKSQVTVGELHAALAMFIDTIRSNFI